jgi:hypothetical protein
VARIEHQLDPVEAHFTAVAQHAVERTDGIIAPEADPQRDFHGYPSLSSKNDLSRQNFRAEVGSFLP